MENSDVARFRGGEYFIFSSPEGLAKEYLGVDQRSSDKQGNCDVVLLPATVTPENPDSYGPTQVSISSRPMAAAPHPSR